MKTKVSLIWAYYSYGTDNVVFTDIQPKERTENIGYWTLSPYTLDYERIKYSLPRKEPYKGLIVYIPEPMRYL